MAQNWHSAKSKIEFQCLTPTLMQIKSSSNPYRTVVCHKNPFSGKLQFVQFASGHICGPSPLPKLATLAPNTHRILQFHPNFVIQDLACYFDIHDTQLLFINEFKLFLEVPHQYALDGLLPIYLTAFTSRELAELPANHQWLEMGNSFSLPYLQREILREAYRILM